MIPPSITGTAGGTIGVLSKKTWFPEVLNASPCLPQRIKRVGLPEIPGSEVLVTAWKFVALKEYSVHEPDCPATVKTTPAGKSGATATAAGKLVTTANVSGLNTCPCAVNINPFWYT